MTAVASQQLSRPRAAPDDDGTAVPVSGIVDARGNQAFVRTRGYRRGRDDVLVRATCLREYGLRTGDLVEGAARSGRQRRPGRPTQPDRETDMPAVLDRVHTINGLEAG